MKSKETLMRWIREGRRWWGKRSQFCGFPAALHFLYLFFFFIFCNDSSFIKSGAAVSSTLPALSLEQPSSSRGFNLQGEKNCARPEQKSKGSPQCCVLHRAQHPHGAGGNLLLRLLIQRCSLLPGHAQWWRSCCLASPQQWDCQDINRYKCQDFSRYKCQDVSRYKCQDVTRYPHQGVILTGFLETLKASKSQHTWIQSFCYSHCSLPLKKRASDQGWEWPF